MKSFARVSFVISMFILAVSVVLLLNVTAPNPTGRRYSSEMPVQSRGSTQEIGVSGETILARDLGVPRNEAPDQRQCICQAWSYAHRSPSLMECRVCIAHVQLSTSTYRRPDFIGATFIAESKNSQNLFYTGREVDQIGDYVFAARAMNRPLWIYTRVNTNVDPEFVRLAESTGGGVVPYFTVPGYVDPVDEAARKGALAGMAGMAGSLVLLRWKRRRPQPSTPWQPDDYPDIFERAKDKAQRTIDEADSRPRR